MCIAHVMRSKIWYLYISRHDVLCHCFLHSFLWNPLLKLPTRFVFNVLHLLCFCAGLSGRLFTVFVVHSVFFLQSFFNSAIPFRTVRTSGLPLFRSWRRTLSHFFPFPLLKWSGVIQHDLWAMKGKVVITWKKELNNEPKVWSQTMLCVFPCPCPV